jgi:hypothetical protein
MIDNKIHPLNGENGKKYKGKSGMILAFALVILVLMSLMGIIIMSNTRTELSITGNTRLSREAFNTADACARISTFLTLVLLNQRTETLEEVFSTYTPANDFLMEIKPQTKFNLEQLLDEATNFDYKQRYLETGAGAEAPAPHIIFEQNGQEVANAVVNLEDYILIPEGMGLGTADAYDSSGGPKLQMGLVVSVTARTEHPVPTAANQDEPSSIVTIMYRNYIN